MKYILFDRDGTLIKDPLDLRVKSIEDLQLFSDTISSLKRLNDKGYSIVIITNQVGIAEGLISESDFDDINGHLIREFEASGIDVVTTYFCPHAPADECLCRKPEPKMLIQAINDFEINPEETFMIGDRRSDILAGIAAGVKTILVRTGTGEQEEAPEADFEAENLTEVVDIILDSQR